MDWREREKVQNREKLKTETYEKNGALYWSVCLTWETPEERPVPMHVFQEADVAPPAGQAAACEEYSTRTIAAYRKAMEGHVESPEELAEMRAAFGTGTTVVNVITGKKTKL